MRAQVYIHLVWTTRDSEPILNASLARWLCRFLRTIAWKERAEVLAIGMVRTHVHLLVHIHPSISISVLVKRLKGASSACAKRNGYAATGQRLYWAKGYSVHSVGPRQLERVVTYLRDQPRHHPTEMIEGDDGGYFVSYRNI